MLVNMHQAKTSLSKLVSRALEGEEVIIAVNNQPMVKLEPIRRKRQRELGTLKGKITKSEDFDASLDDFKDYQ